MGWSIITSVVFIICILILSTCDPYSQADLQRDLQIVFRVTSVISFTFTLGLCIGIVDTVSKEKVIISQYENLKTISSELNVSSEEVIEDILNMNKKICKHRIYANNFMTMGLYSKEVGELQLLEIPEVMKVGPIDYE